MVKKIKLFNGTTGTTKYLEKQVNEFIQDKESVKLHFSSGHDFNSVMVEYDE